MIERNNQAFVAAQIESRRNGRYGSRTAAPVTGRRGSFTPHNGHED